MPAPPEPAAPSAGQPATQPAAPPAVSAPVVTAPVMTAPPSAPAPSGGVSSDLLVYALVGVVAIFSLVLIVAFWPKQTPAPAPPIRVMMPTVGPQPPVILPATSHPAPPPLMVSNVPPELPTQLAGASRSPAAAKATEIFLDLGAELVVLDGPDRGKHFVLTKPRIGIGRSGSRQNEVTLNDETVSREHARIIYSSSDQSFRLINESSTNPVKVNGNPVESVLLQDEDVIKLGASSLKFKKVWSPAAGSKS